MQGPADGGRRIAPDDNAPLAFEANRGQSDPNVRFLAHGSRSAFFLTDREAVLALHDGAGKCAALRMTLGGARPATPEGRDRRPGTAAYFVGNDPSGWIGGVPLWGSVRKSGVYPGVDLVYYGRGHQLEYDFVVAAGASPIPIRIELRGADRAELRNGELLLETPAGPVRQHRPVAYQQDANGRRRPVPVRYELRSRLQGVRLAAAEIGFRLGRYDRRRPLVIDPILSYSTFLGGGRGAAAGGVAMDGAGNTYVVGTTASPDFPSPSWKFGGGGHLQVFVTKVSPSGAVVSSTVLGGHGNDEGRGIAVDSTGVVTLCGVTSSADFPLSHALQREYADRPSDVGDAFVTRLDARGSRLLYSTYLGKAGPDQANGVAVDPQGAAYVVGTTEDIPDIPPPPAAATPHSVSPLQGTGVFVVKLSPSGDAVEYSTIPITGLGSTARAIAVDGTGAACIAGSVTTGFQATPGAFQNKRPDAAVGPRGTIVFLTDAFVQKLGPNGQTAWATLLGGTQNDEARGVAIDAAGFVTVTGWTNSPDFPVKDALQPSLNGPSDAFLVKLDSTGTSAVYSTYLGGSGPDEGDAVAVDAAGSAFVVGTTASSDFPLVSPLPRQPSSGIDVFVAKVVSGPATLVFSTRLGGSDTEQGVGIAVDRYRNIAVTGNTTSRDFPVNRGAQRQLRGAADAFLVRISPTPPPPGTARCYTR
jgi:hypothetical protein